MVKVRATTRGYVGLVLREPGEVFEWPADQKVGSWVVPHAFGGKGDHDGDGLTGGSVPASTAGDGEKKLDSLTIPELRDIAADRGVDLAGVTKKADIIKAIEAGPQEPAEPFADAPPVRVHNEVNEATGGTAPDWLPPSADDKPVMAND